MLMSVRWQIRCLTLAMRIDDAASGDLSWRWISIECGRSKHSAALRGRPLGNRPQRQASCSDAAGNPQAWFRAGEIISSSGIASPLAAPSALRRAARGRPRPPASAAACVVLFCAHPCAEHSPAEV